MTASIVSVIACYLSVKSRVVDRHPQTGLRCAIILNSTSLVALAISPSVTPTVIWTVLWGLSFGALSTLVQAVALRAAPAAPDAAPAVVNSMFNVGIAGGALLGAREVAVAAPPMLAWTGAVLVAGSLILLRVVGRPTRPADSTGPERTSAPAS